MDVSEWQGRIDWAKAKADGIEYAIIRVGWHGNNDSHVDDWFEYNVSECERLGIPYGVYLYSYITTTAGATNAANFVLNQLKGHIWIWKIIVRSIQTMAPLPRLS